ncbi:hypothetical protein PUR28_01180 [Streptomyces sp. BE308]|nr:hypothetical protein [Streptomyces sp. BE308]MEE1789406.1 hypothetical protein [Streptomyces sp. BE308]
MSAARHLPVVGADPAVDVMPADAEIWARVPASTGVLPDCEDIALRLPGP